MDARRWLEEPAPAGYELGIHAFSKINLGLRVGERRADGYHEILTTFQTIDFADTIWARPRRCGFVLRVIRRGPARSRGFAIPRDSGNFVLRAARRLQRELGTSEGAELLLVKRVPSGSGLGGGSSDAVATLRLLARLWNRRLGAERRREIGTALGSDCAFFVRGGRARARGRGERLRRLPVEGPRRVLLLLPKRGLSTARVYRLWEDSKHLTPERRLHTLSAPQRVVPVGRRARSLMPNDLEEVVHRHRPDVAAARALLEAEGVTAVQMSGSGSAVYGLLAPRARPLAIGRHALRRSYEVVYTRFTGVGSRWCR